MKQPVVARSPHGAERHMWGALSLVYLLNLAQFSRLLLHNCGYSVMPFNVFYFQLALYKIFLGD